MTIQFLTQYGPYSPHTPVTLSPSEETRLVGLGLARNYTSTTDDHSPLAITYDPDTGAQSAGPYSVSGAGIAVGIFGQSNERGQVLQSDAATYTQAFQCIRHPAAYTGPLPGIVTLQSNTTGPYGSPWFKFIDDLWDWGYDVKLFNGAVGSLSMISDAAGQVKTRANSTAYAHRRTPVGPDDFGYMGDLTVQGGKLFLCTSGRNRFASRRVPILPGTNTGGQAKYDYIANVGTAASAGADPGGWAATALGGTVADGTVTWTNIDDTNSVGFSNAQVFNENQNGYGWDPLGLCERLHMNMQAIPAAQRHIIISNGQSDLGQTGAVYTTALTNVANYFLRRGYTVWLGLTCYTPTATTANYDALASGLATSIASTQAGTWGARAMAGANNYALMGTTGNMANGGAYLQGDNVHLTGPGAIEFGKNWADVFKASLPRRR